MVFEFINPYASSDAPEGQSLIPLAPCAPSGSGMDPVESHQDELDILLIETGMKRAEPIPLVQPEPPMKEAQPAQAAPAQPDPRGLEPVDDLRIRRTECGCYGSIGVYGISLQGKSHVERAVPCQDYHYFEYAPAQQVLVLAIADGVGSCPDSHYGSEMAVRYTVQHLLSAMKDRSGGGKFHLTGGDDALVELLKEAFVNARNAVDHRADELNKLPYNLQSTLTVALYDGHTLWYGHVGDDGIVAQGESGRYLMVTKRVKGEEASSVYTLQTDENNRAFHRVNNVTGFLMATDGVLDNFVRGEAEGNRVYYPFMSENLYSMSCTDPEHRAAQVEAACQRAEATLSSDLYRTQVTDDITLVAVANLDSLITAKKPDFDKQEWDRQTAEYRKRLNEALYAKHQTQVKAEPHRQIQTSSRTVYGQSAKEPGSKSAPIQKKNETSAYTYTQSAPRLAAQAPIYTQSAPRPAAQTKSPRSSQPESSHPTRKSGTLGNDNVDGGFFSEPEDLFDLGYDPVSEVLSGIAKIFIPKSMARCENPNCPSYLKLRNLGNGMKYCPYCRSRLRILDRD